MKPSSTYYHQVQHTLGVLQLRECDFVIWTNVDILVVPVTFDENLWSTTVLPLTKVHKELIVPEYFAMRAPRDLHQLELD